MGNAKVEILVMPGKKLLATEFPVIKRALNGKSFPLLMSDDQLKGDGEVAQRGETAERIVDLLCGKAPGLKQAQKVIIKTSQFKTVPDDCAVLLAIEGDKDGEVKSTVKLDRPKSSDLTKRAGYKPVTQTCELGLEGEAFHDSADLHDTLIIANPSYSLTVKIVGPELSGATLTKLGTAAQFILDGVAKKIGVAVGKSGLTMARLAADPDAADKEIPALHKVVQAELAKIEPAVMKALEAQRAKLKGAEPGIEYSKFDCSEVMRFSVDRSKANDPANRKPIAQEIQLGLEGEDLYAGANLHDMVIIANPSYSITLRSIGPGLAGATLTKLGTVVQFILDGAAKRIGVAADKAGQTLAKMVSELDGDGADKEVAALNKLVSAEVNKIHPSVLKAVEAQKAKLKNSDRMIEYTQFEASAVARFTKFLPAPDLQAMMAVYGPSKNDKQVGPLTKKRKKLLEQLKDDTAERKSFAAGVGPFLTGLGRGDDVAGLADKAADAAYKFNDHLSGFKEALDNMVDVIETVKKNNKKEQPKGKEVAKEDKVDWDMVMKKTKKLEDLMIGLTHAMTNAMGFVGQCEEVRVAADSKVRTGQAAKLADKLKSIPGEGVTSDLNEFKKLSQVILEYIKD